MARLEEKDYTYFTTVRGMCGGALLLKLNARHCRSPEANRYFPIRTPMSAASLLLSLIGNLAFTIKLEMESDNNGKYIKVDSVADFAGHLWLRGIREDIEAFEEAEREFQSLSISLI